jgi:hypothetical protein
MRARRLFLALWAAALTAGCTPIVNKNPLELHERKVLTSRSVVMVRRPVPTFQLYRISDGYLQYAGIPFGLVGIWGTFAAVTADAERRSDAFLAVHKLTDPAIGVAAELGKRFSQQGVAFAGLTEEVVETRDEGEVAKSLKGRADFALDLRTEYWGLSANPILTKYRFGYRAAMLLIDLDTGTTIASGQCRFWPEYSQARPFKEWTELNAERLKEAIRAATDACAAHLTDSVLDQQQATAPGASR